MQSRSPVSCSSQLVLRVFLSTASRICKEVMGPDDSRSRSPVRTKRCRSRILGMFPFSCANSVGTVDIDMVIASTVLTFRSTRTMIRFSKSCQLQWRRLWALGKSRWVFGVGRAREGWDGDALRLLYIASWTGMYSAGGLRRDGRGRSLEKTWPLRWHGALPTLHYFVGGWTNQIRASGIGRSL